MNFSTILTVAFSGAFLAFLQFLITFFITRKDNKEKEAKEEIKEKEKSAKDERFIQLEKRIDEGLAQREEMGKSRYEEHHKSIEKISRENQENFDKLLSAIEDLKERDNKVAETLDKIADGQEIFSTGLLGLTHFELMYITDIIKERKYITLTEKATLDSLFDPYTRLGGNGQTKKNYEFVMALPVISEEEAKKMDDGIAAIKANTYFGKTFNKE